MNNTPIDDFDQTFNYRSAYQDEQIDYIAALRDAAIFDNYGLQVSVKIPRKENNLDQYENYIDEIWDNNDWWKDQKLICVPKFNEYRQMLSKKGMTADGTDGSYGLEVLIPTKYHLPRNSRVILDEYTAENNKVSREWTVVSTIAKQLSNSKTYSHIATLVPARLVKVSNTKSCDICILSEIDPIFDYFVTYKLESYISQSVIISSTAGIPPKPKPKLGSHLEQKKEKIRIKIPSSYIM